MIPGDEIRRHEVNQVTNFWVQYSHGEFRDGSFVKVPGPFETSHETPSTQLLKS